MSKTNWHNPYYKNCVLGLSLVLIISILTGCVSSVTTPVATVVDRTVVVVVTATNPPATAVPTIPPETATLTQTATAASTATSVPTVVLPSPTLEASVTATITKTPTPKPLPTLVPIAQVTITGPVPGNIRYLPVASTQMNLQYVSDQAAGGPKVTSVSFNIFLGTELVFSSQDNKYPYCAFGDNGSICNPLIFDDYVYTWPDNHISIRSGSYSLRVLVQDDESPSNSWKLDVPFKIKLP